MFENPHPALCCCLGSSRGLLEWEEGVNQRKDRMRPEGQMGGKDPSKKERDTEGRQREGQN